MKNISLIMLLIGVLASLTRCGTISSGIVGGKRPVYLINPPRDLRVLTNGEKMDVSSEVFAYTPSYGGSGTTYYTSGVKLPFKKRLQLELQSGTKRAVVELKPKTRAVYHIATLFIFPIGGNILDATTKNDKELYPRFIDVQAALAGISQKEWISQGKLKRQTKRKASIIYY